MENMEDSFDSDVIVTTNKPIRKDDSPHQMKYPEKVQNKKKSRSFLSKALIVFLACSIFFIFFIQIEQTKKSQETLLEKLDQSEKSQEALLQKIKQLQQSINSIEYAQKHQEKSRSDLQKKNTQAAVVVIPPQNLQPEVEVLQTHFHGLEGLHQHPNKIINYPTVGVPHPHTTFNFTKVEKKDMLAFDKEINQLFKPYNDTDCEFTRIGRVNDGGYVVCANHFKKAEYLVNFGIRDDDVFGCDLSSLIKVPNYQYDCTTNIPQLCHTNNNLNSFEMVCGGEMTEKTSLYSFASLEDVIKNKKLVGKRIFLKIDIEGGEYEAFRYLPTDYLDYFDQITMEAHFGSIYPEMWGHLDMFKSLAEKFISVNYHINNNACFGPDIMQYRAMPALAFEVTLINKKLITVHSQTRSFKQHPLNTPNNPKVPDCQIKQN